MAVTNTGVPCGVMKVEFGERIGGQCPVETAVRLLGGRYKSSILWALREGKLRYGELQRRVPQASAKMLSEQLREMCEDGLVSKTVYASVPPKTEYALTGQGEAAIPALMALTEFGRGYLEDAQSDATGPT